MTNFLFVFDVKLYIPYKLTSNRLNNHAVNVLRTLLLYQCGCCGTVGYVGNDLLFRFRFWKSFDSRSVSGSESKSRTGSRSTDKKHFTKSYLFIVRSSIVSQKDFFTFVNEKSCVLGVSSSGPGFTTQLIFNVISGSDPDQDLRSIASGLIFTNSSCSK
jgi:hypothetical protein